MLSVQVSCVAVDVYCDSHNNPAGRPIETVDVSVIICKTNARKSHVEQIHCRSDVEYPRSVLLKALHLVHAHHCRKTCKEVKRPGTRVKESVRRNLLSPMQVRDKPTKNEHDKHETDKGICGARRHWKVFEPISLRQVFPEVFLLLIRQSPVQLFVPHEDVIIHTQVCKRPCTVQQYRRHVAKDDPRPRSKNEVLQVLVLEMAILETQQRVLRRTK